MGRKRMPGLFKRGDQWHIDKQVGGRRIRKSTGAVTLEEAERYLVRQLEEVRQASIYGVRPKRSFKEAATKFLMENQHKASIRSDAGRLRILVDFIGHIPLDAIHMGSLQPYIEARRKDGRKTRTINHGLQVVRRILNLAASEWVDEYGLTWLAATPKIKLLPEYDSREAYPISWDEQAKLFQALPDHLAQMALFAVNTGCRDTQICWLKWEWEVQVPELNTSVFIVPKYTIENGKRIWLVKNRQDHVVVLNQIAKSVVDSARGQHPVFVFTYRGKHITRMLNKGWISARKKVALPHVRVHDLRHTYGRRLRAAGVSLEDRQDLLGHKSSRMTTHYSAAELDKLLEAANKVCDRQHSGPTLTLLRRNPHKIPTLGFEGSRKSSVSA
jgi:integrase